MERPICSQLALTVSHITALKLIETNVKLSSSWDGHNNLYNVHLQYVLLWKKSTLI